MGIFWYLLQPDGSVITEVVGSEKDLFHVVPSASPDVRRSLRQKTNPITCDRGFVTRNESTDQNKAPIQTT